MTLNLWLSMLLRPETPRDKWLRAAITGAGAALALIIAIVLFATSGADEEDTNTAETGATLQDIMSAASSDWETVTGSVIEVRRFDVPGEEGDVAETISFVKYEYTTDAYYIREQQLPGTPYAVGDSVTVYYAPDNNASSTLLAPGTSSVALADDNAADNDTGDDSGNSNAAGGIFLLVVSGLLTAFTVVQIIDLRRDAMGPD